MGLLNGRRLPLHVLRLGERRVAPHVSTQWRVLGVVRQAACDRLRAALAAVGSLLDALRVLAAGALWGGRVGALWYPTAAARAHATAIFHGRAHAADVAHGSLWHVRRDAREACTTPPRPPSRSLLSAAVSRLRCVPVRYLPRPSR